MNVRKHLSRQRGQSRRGFTLIEVLLVAGIIVMLAAIVVPNLIGAEQSAKIKTTKANVQALAKAFDNYKFTYELDYPTGDGFSALVNGPGNLPNWVSQIESARPVDAWGKPINYQFPGTHNKMGKPDIWSNGPDGQSGTADDITSWTVAK